MYSSGLRSSRPRKLVVLACLALLATVACGPRYERGSQVQGTTTSSELGDTTSIPGGAPRDGSVAAPGTTANRDPRTGAPVPAGSVQGPVDGVPSAPGSIATQTYRGATKDSITIGVMASETVNQAYEALGATGAFPDPKAQVEPIVKWINANGGVAGRKLEIVWHMRDDLGSDTDDTKMQQACTDFVQDKKVFLVTSIYQAHGMAPCLADNDIPLIESGAGPAHYGVPTFDKLGGYYVTPNQISVDRYARSLVEGIAKQGFFKGSVRVGLIYMGFDYAHAAVERSLKPALKKLGVTLTDEQELRPIERASDFAGTQAEVSNAVLRFKQKNINRVIGLEDQATTFMTSAEQQDYYPRYGIGSLSLFGAAESYPESMDDTALVGSNVQMDVRPQYRGAPLEGEKVCRKLYLDSKQAPDDELAWGLMEWHCEGFFFIKAVLDRLTVLSSRGVIAAIESLGTAYKPITVYGMRLARGQYDGVARVRPLKFVADCTCLKYAGSAYAIP
jgi:ABC-type branched-subunit amino acid transport system substrate-binding protein